MVRFTCLYCNEEFDDYFGENCISGEGICNEDEYECPHCGKISNFRINKKIPNIFRDCGGIRFNGGNPVFLNKDAVIDRYITNEELDLINKRRKYF